MLEGGKHFRRELCAPTRATGRERDRHHRVSILLQRQHQPGEPLPPAHADRSCKFAASGSSRTRAPTVPPAIADAPISVTVLRRLPALLTHLPRQNEP